MCIRDRATVSHRISALEEELGYQLILRGQGVRKIELTYRGEQFIPIAEQWSSLWSNSLAIRNADYRMPRFIGGTNRLNTHFLPDFYDYFARSSENVVLEIHSYHSWEIFDPVSYTHLDVYKRQMQNVVAHRIPALPRISIRPLKLRLRYSSMPSRIA